MDVARATSRPMRVVLLQVCNRWRSTYHPSSNRLAEGPLDLKHSGVDRAQLAMCRYWTSIGEVFLRAALHSPEAWEIDT
jgi:hypothetical protein